MTLEQYSQSHNFCTLQLMFATCNAVLARNLVMLSCLKALKESPQEFWISWVHALFQIFIKVLSRMYDVFFSILFWLFSIFVVVTHFLSHACRLSLKWTFAKVYCITYFLLLWGENNSYLLNCSNSYYFISLFLVLSYWKWLTVFS